MSPPVAPNVEVKLKLLSAVCPSASVILIVKLYVVGVVDEPPKSVVVNAPVDVFKVTPAPLKLEVVSEYAIVLSDEPEIVASVPEKFPAKVPSEPADVLNVGAVEDVIILFVLLPALPSGFSILT